MMDRELSPAKITANHTAARLVLRDLVANQLRFRVVSNHVGQLWQENGTHSEARQGVLFINEELKRGFPRQKRGPSIAQETISPREVYSHGLSEYPGI